MKKKNPVLILILLMLSVIIIRWLGVGYHYSGAAAYDFIEELESIYGTEYTGKTVENGTEDLVFVIEPKTFFLTNYSLRNYWGLDYKYECKAVFTTCIDGVPNVIRTITYKGIDPMGFEFQSVGAYLDLSSMTETIETK